MIPLWREVVEFVGGAWHKCPGNILFARIGGSHSYGLELPSSDLDFNGVYICPTSQVVGMNFVQQTWEHTGDPKPDYSFYEVGHFCRLLIKGNPTVVEMLYTNENVWQDINNMYWHDLRTHRKKFLSRTVLKQYLGYINAQFQRFTKNQSLHTTGGQPNEKWSYHILRLGMDALSIASGQEITVKKSGKEKQLLLDVRTGKYSRLELEKMIEESIAKIESLPPWEDLPECGDKEFLEGWLLKIRKENWSLLRRA